MLKNKNSVEVATSTELKTKPLFNLRAEKAKNLFDYKTGKSLAQEEKLKQVTFNDFLGALSVVIAFVSENNCCPYCLSEKLRVSVSCIDCNEVLKVLEKCQGAK